MQCANCGVEMIAGAAFCPSCGKPIGLVAGASASGEVAPGLQRNGAGALCYLAGLITGIAFLVVKPYRHDPFVRFHAFQAILVSVAWFVAHLVLAIVTTILPGVPWRVVWLLRSMLDLGSFLLWLLLMFKAYSYEQFKLPFVGDLAASL